MRGHHEYGPNFGVREDWCIKVLPVTTNRVNLKKKSYLNHFLSESPHYCAQIESLDV